ncbi:hypothetical protein PORY_000845 [Pneumocystis oryctolagi]|uniref:Uncharacterized protein n=1 Tax=Pneumocystis oryctolagi TaxID=42067 RepID=A0ACB7CFT1_9ASCO|nr:hypothetical protein PORY_000845 [Pneumocystis oryctolagi]
MKNTPPFNHKNDKSQHHSFTDPLFESLHRASKAINMCITKDENYPEIGDILTQGYSSDYNLPLHFFWKPFSRISVMNIPDAIFEQYNKTECYTQMGLFPEIQRAWITVDNRLYLWNYLNGEDFQSYEDLDRTIICIKLVKPRAGVFIDSIEFLLVISTLNDIFLLGVEYLASKSSENTKELVFYSTKMSVSVSGIDVLCIEGTSDGRIFFSGKQDDSIYEILYQADDGWFSKRCSKINHTGTIIDKFIPKGLWFDWKNETIQQLVMDNSRNLLYALTSKSSIRAYHLQNQQSLNHVISYSYRSILAHAQMVNASSSLLDPRTTTIISLAPVPLSESNQIYLIAITSTGCRLYLRASRSIWSVNGPPSTMTCTHVRFPPADSDNKQEDYKTQSSNISYKVLNNNILLNSPSSFILTSVRIGHIFSPGYFLAFKPSSTSEGDQLFASAADTGRILYGTLNNHRLSFVETAGWIPLEGYVQAVSLLTPPIYCPNELKTQYNTASPQIAVLTNTGVHVIQRRNNFQILYSAIKYGVSTLNGIEGEVQSFFEMVGQAEGCATCLGLICGRIDAASQPDEYYNVKHFSNRNNVLTDSDIVEIARKYYIEFGGKPFTKQTQYKFGQETLDLDNVQLSGCHDGQETLDLDNVQLSGCHDGLVIYIARSIGELWKKPFIKLTINKKLSTKIYSSNFSASTLLRVRSEFITLLEFFDNNKSYIKGLVAPDQLSGSMSRSEEISFQAEHRALHALVLLIRRIIEGLSFVYVLIDDTPSKLHDIISSLSKQSQDNCLKLTFEDLFSKESGKDLAKDLVTAIVNKQLADGGSVDAVSESLRKRCGGFCSADDVIMYKAIEQLRRAKEKSEFSEEKKRSLQECLRLFMKIAPNLTLENLNETVTEFKDLSFHTGAIELCLTVAKAFDPDDLSLSYIIDGLPQNDFRYHYYNRRMKYYSLKSRRILKSHSQLNLISYLLLPIQRIPRYKLLLFNLLECQDSLMNFLHETSNCDMEKSWKRLLYVSTIFLGLVRPRDLELNNILFAMKALSIGTFICIGTFGLGIAAISKALKVKNFEEFSTVIRIMIIQMNIYLKIYLDDFRYHYYNRRMKYYSLIFETLLDIDKIVEETLDSDNSNIILLRDDTYKTAYLSRDELFHYSLYDWYVERGMLERILNIETPYVQTYLERKSINNLDLADLLWQYHSRHGLFYEAARVLYELAQSNFPITLGQRIEYLSRGKSLCNCDVSLEIRPMMNKLAHDLQEELDVITIQDDIIQSIRGDERLSYGEICLAIFHVSDYRGKADIIQCWEKIIAKENDLALNKGIKAYEAISDLIRRLGRKFGSSESVFPLEDLIPMLEVYSFERQDDGIPQGWVIESLLSAGISHSLIFSILDEMIDRQESPWQTKSAVVFLIKDVVYLVTLWIRANTKAGFGRNERPLMKNNIVLIALNKYSVLISNNMKLKESITRLIGDINKLI